MPKKITQRKSNSPPPARAADVPVTQKMLFAVRDELKSDVKSLDHKMDGRFAQVDARFAQVDTRFVQIDARFEQIDARFEQVDLRFGQVDSRAQSLERKMDLGFERMRSEFRSLESRMDARFEKLTSEVHRIALLVEEQNARNNIVLDGLTSLFHRQERIEERVERIEKN